MKTKSISFSITIILLILISGCISMPFDIFGRDVISVQNVVTKDRTVDVMAVKEITTIPRSPMLPDQPAVLSFIIENRDDLKPLERVVVDMYNAPLFKNEHEILCNLYQNGMSSCIPSDCARNQACKILAGEEKLITFNMITPTEKEIVNIKTQEKLDFRVNYDFDGSLLYTVPVVNMDEIINRQRQGEKTTVQISKAHSSGPLQIDVELFGSQYILSGYSATFLFKIRNLGSGVLTGKNEIGKGNFIIEFPGELVNDYITLPDGNRYPELGATPLPVARDIYDIIAQAPSVFKSYEYPSGGLVTGFATETVPTETKTEKQFDCRHSGMSVICTNLKEIPLYKDETRMSLRFEMPHVISLGLDQPFKSYEIRAYVKYIYELRNSVDVTINPYGNV